MFADFRIANSQGTAVSRLPTEKLTTTLSKINLRVHDKAQLQQSSIAENWLAGPEKNTDSADGTGPAFSRDTKNSRLAARVNGKFANFRYFKAAAVPLATALVCLILCFTPLAMSGAGQSVQPVPGKVTLVYFHADWCAPCKPMSRALEQMAASDADIALRKIDVTNPGAAEEHNIQALPYVKVYNRGGSLVGTVVGLDVEKINSYVAQAKS